MYIVILHLDFRYYLSKIILKSLNILTSKISDECDANGPLIVFQCVCTDIFPSCSLVYLSVTTNKKSEGKNIH